ncbi:hypothetical protein GGF45_004722 [Coemansia sp. RSA 551]|nr:hypothetical protein GGF45_004722 [Coemansia sp. RSA 551]
MFSPAQYLFANFKRVLVVNADITNLIIKMFDFLIFILLNTYCVVRNAFACFESPNPPFEFETTAAELKAANEKLCLASDALTKKIEAIRARVHNSRASRFKVKEATAANDGLRTASSDITEKIDVTAFKAKKATASLKHDVLTCKWCIRSRQSDST